MRRSYVGFARWGPAISDGFLKRGGTESIYLEPIVSFRTYVGHEIWRIGHSLYQVHVSLHVSCREKNRAPGGGSSQTIRSYPSRRVFIATLSCPMLRGETKRKGHLYRGIAHFLCDYESITSLNYYIRMCLDHAAGALYFPCHKRVQRLR